MNLGKWPYWYRLVCTMYGNDIAIQHLFPNISKQSRHRYLLDVDSSDNDNLTQNMKHVHAFHTDDFFSKFNYTSQVYYACKILSLDKKWETIRWILSSKEIKAHRVSNFCEWTAHRETADYILHKDCLS